MTFPQIIGIVLVKDEDIYIERVLKNIVLFCDVILVADNMSTDQTAVKVQALSRRYPSIRYHRIEHLYQSHDLIKGYAGRDVWVFGVDGDEIYDPVGLQIFRRQLLDREYDAWWVVFGNVLHCTELDTEKKIAAGYLAPPSRSMTKLYNFRAIERWERSSGERLHGGEILFRSGYKKELRCFLYEAHPWHQARLRCLHMCFSRRSSLQQSWKGGYVPRPNPADILSRTVLQTMGAYLKQWLRIPVQGKQEWKGDKYTQGPLESVDVADFFIEDWPGESLC